MSQWTAEDVARHNAKLGAKMPAHTKPSKFHNKKTETDGLIFDSAKEANRYGILKHLQAIGHISGLETQPTLAVYVDDPNDEAVFICDYKPDFKYVDAHGRVIFEDVKSKITKTPIYQLKKKLVEALYGFVITEI